MAADRDPLNKSNDHALPFCCQGEDGRLRINLRAGQTSISRFRWRTEAGELRAHFFYNRRFSPSEVHHRGTYSRPLRPDFTLVIIPSDIAASDWREAERLAEEAGTVAYLHFDAKYRIDTLVQLFGESEVRDEELDAEKQASKTTGTFKRADLYKMHTYNEAIRRTVGSYVLYPGDDPKNIEGENRFERYHEIISGVGAFALKPGAVADEEPAGLSSVVGFVGDILSHQLSRFTQSYRITYWTEDTIREVPVTNYGPERITIALPDAPIVLGFMAQDREPEFREQKYFYCRAIEEDGPVDIDITAAAGATFLGWTAPRVGDRISYPWIATIESCRLLPKTALEEKIGRETSSESPYYLYFKLTDLRPFSRRNLNSIIPTNSYKARSFKWKDIATQPVA
jgi:hypothetical protein